MQKKLWQTIKNTSAQIAWTFDNTDLANQIKQSHLLNQYPASTLLAEGIAYKIKQIGDKKYTRNKITNINNKNNNNWPAFKAKCFR